MNKMKKIIPIAAVLAIIVVVVIVESGAGNKSDKKSQSNELFAGSGELRQGKRLNGLGAIYNDDYIFFDSQSQVYTKADRSEIGTVEKLSVNCRNAACAHTGDFCEAYVESGEYFVFNNKVYKYYNEKKAMSGEMKDCGCIVDANSGEEVFKNSIPEDMAPELAVDDSEAILYVRVLSDDLLKIDGDRHAYILDKDFKVKYCHYNIGKFPWGAVFGDYYYYINDIYQMVKINLSTSESEVLDLGEKIFIGDNDEDNIYFSNRFSELYKLSVEDNTYEKIADGVLFFSVQDKYIYTSEGDSGKRKIYDKEGNEIGDYTKYKNMGADNAFQIGDKIYTVFEDGVAYMDEDGKNYGEMTK